MRQKRVKNAKILENGKKTGGFSNKTGKNRKGSRKQEKTGKTGETGRPVVIINYMYGWAPLPPLSFTNDIFQNDLAKNTNINLVQIKR